MGQESETVSREAHDRIVKERDDLKAKVDDLTGQVTSLGDTVKDLHKENAVRKALVGKVADPEVTAQLLTPQLRDVEADEVADHIGSDEFASRLSAFRAAETPTPAPEGEGDGEGDGPPGSVEPADGGFGGPSPGGDAGAQPPDGKKPIQVGSPEYKELLGDRDAFAKAQKDGRIAQPTPTY